MRPSFALPLILALAAFSAPLSPLQAHEPLEESWCPDASKQARIVQSFQLSGQQVSNLALENEALLTPYGLVANGLAEWDGPPGYRCGVVDEWLMARYIANTYCADKAGGDETPIAYLTGPESFLEQDHHEGYRYGRGLQGVCVVCGDE